VVKTAIQNHGWRIIGIEDGYDGLVETPRWRELTLESVSGILPRGGTILGTSNRGKPFRCQRIENGVAKTYDALEEVVARLRSIGVDALIVVGGNGTLKIARKLNELGLPVVGVPKTIDNDLQGTDVSFGYRTAVGIVAEALDRLHTTAESHHRALFVEVMGRNAGWIAVEAGIAGSADAILIPEIPYSMDKLCAAVKRSQERGHRYFLVVIAEGAHAAGGGRVVVKPANGNVGVERLGGIAHQAAYALSQRAGIETRVVTLGHLQRGGTPSSFDRVLATRFGVKAVELIDRGDYGKMVALKGGNVVAVDIACAVSELNLVDPGGELVATAEALGIMVGR
jgi:6-phosphofructokinase 1